MTLTDVLPKGDEDNHLHKASQGAREFHGVLGISWMGPFMIKGNQIYGVLDIS
jgi:hypothetical protein